MKIIIFYFERVRDRHLLVDTFNVDPIYLRHAHQNENESVAPDLRVCL